MTHASGRAHGRQLGPRTPCRRLLGESTASGWGEGRASAPGGNWRPERIGPVPSQYSVSARLDVERFDPRSVRGPGQSGDTAGGGRCSGGLAAVPSWYAGRDPGRRGAGAGRAVGSARFPGVDGVRSTGPDSGIPAASGRRDGRVRGAGRVRIRLGRPGRRSRGRITRHAEHQPSRVEAACGRGRRLEGLRMGGRRAFQPSGVVRLGGWCCNGGRSVLA